MRAIAISAFAILVLLVASSRIRQPRAHAQTSSYSAMAPLNQYLIPDENTEIALARSAAPSSISNGAEVMVLGRNGYTTAVKGVNGFLCIVERSWGATTDEPEFWNPKIRSPICFNPAAARTFAPIFLMKTKLVLAGKSKPGNRQGDRIGAGQKGTARAGTWCDVLHDVEAAVFERPGQELGATC